MPEAGGRDRTGTELTRAAASKYVLSDLGSFSDFGSTLLPCCPVPTPNLFWTRTHRILVECCVS